MSVTSVPSTSSMALPMAIQSVTVFRQPEAADDKRLYGLIKAINDGEQFDAQVVDDSGALYAIMTGYRTVQLPGSVTLQS